MKNQRINFKVNEEIKNWIIKQTQILKISESEFMRKIVIEMKEGKLIYYSDSKESIEFQKLEILKESSGWKIKKIKSDIIRNGAETDFKRALVEEYKNKNRKLPKNILKIANKLQDESYSKNPIVREGLMCISCGIVFVFDFDDKEEVLTNSQKYANHVYQKHRKTLMPEEEVRLLEINEKFNLL